MLKVWDIRNWPANSNLFRSRLLDISIIWIALDWKSLISNDSIVNLYNGPHLGNFWHVVRSKFNFSDWSTALVFIRHLAIWWTVYCTYLVMLDLHDQIRSSRYLSESNNAMWDYNLKPQSYPLRHCNCIFLFEFKAQRGLTADTNLNSE